MTMSEAKDLATLVGVLIGAISLAFGAFSLVLTTKTNRAKFWLELRGAFAKHDDVHRKLRPGGEWSESRGPSNTDEYHQTEAYMGLFEHCEIMLSQDLIDEPTFREIYRYRLVNLVDNQWVRDEKLRLRPDGWKNFIALLKRMGVPYGSDNPPAA